MPRKTRFGLSRLQFSDLVFVPTSLIHALLQATSHFDSRGHPNFRPWPSFYHGASGALGKKEPVMATSDHDEKLHQMLLALSPGNIRDDEACAVAATAYNTGRDLKREWRVVYPPGVQNFLVNTGRRPGGLCFQFATVLLLRLDALKLQTLELHWAEAFAREGGEHNVIVVTAKGQPFERGVILDNWREGGN